MIAIIDYKAGNLTSVKLAFDTLGVESEITSAREKILAADRVVFPGVGAAGSAMNNLTELDLIDTIRLVTERNTPFLGICLGTQIILERSQENNGTSCIGLIPGDVVMFTPSSPYDKIPQMGWNSVSLKARHPVLEKIDDGSEFYFVHSYYPVPSDSKDVLGTTDYADVSFASIIGRENIIATQFHPEKSGRVGLKLLENFTRWDGTPVC